MIMSERLSSAAIRSPADSIATIRRSLSWQLANEPRPGGSDAAGRTAHDRPISRGSTALRG